MYRVRILDAATRELARLDKPIGRRVAERIHWLAVNLDNINRRIERILAEHEQELLEAWYEYFGY